jgi:hypothetical protein
MKLEVIKRQAGRGNRGNGNAISHGCFSTITGGNIDGRCRLAKTYNYLVANLLAELGGEPSLQERLLVERIAAKSIRCMLAETQILQNDNATSQSLETRYLAWANSLRLDLGAIGLERRARPILDLKSCIEEVKE